ncbi:carboxylesterase family protein [Embleya sp. MST-111070]|uniref:carboxylesterase family protein n=1 Tax=Embleya sp. MST-111070 TaxID=3398231 RepID=UPI003F734B69
MSERPRAHTAEGIVEGRRRNGHAVFCGIPYARPPVGPLRFRAPAPVEGWQGTREAGEFRPVAPQAGPTAEHSVGDDWLTPNIATPTVGAAGLPVPVWIHGGAYIAGSSGDPMYDPAAPTAAGPVVVGVNYRVGVEGHAGAGSIAALSTLERARGLFRGAIVHSVAGLLCTLDLARDVTAALAARVGHRPTPKPSHRRSRRYPGNYSGRGPVPTPAGRCDRGRGSAGPGRPDSRGAGPRVATRASPLRAPWRVRAAHDAPDHQTYPRNTLVSREPTLLGFGKVNP